MFTNLLKYTSCFLNWGRCFVLPLFKNNRQGHGEMAQWLRLCAALIEDPGLVPRTHTMMLTTTCSSSFREFLASWASASSGAHKLMQAHIHGRNESKGKWRKGRKKNRQTGESILLLMRWKENYCIGPAQWLSWEMVLAAKPDNWSLVPGPHIVWKEKTDFHRLFSVSWHTWAHMAHTLNK